MIDGLVGSITSAVMEAPPTPEKAQLAPPSMLLKTPVSPPAKTFEGVEGSTARARTTPPSGLMLTQRPTVDCASPATGKTPRAAVTERIRIAEQRHTGANRLGVTLLAR